MHSAAQFCFDCLQLGHHAPLCRFPPDGERSIAPALPAVVREAQERKGIAQTRSVVFSPDVVAVRTSLAILRISRVAFLQSGGSRRPDFAFFEAQSPGPPIPLSTLQAASRDVSCKTQDQNGVAASFLVGLFHSLQHAGLTRRSLTRLLGNWPSTSGKASSQALTSNTVAATALVLFCAFLSAYALESLAQLTGGESFALTNAATLKRSLLAVSKAVPNYYVLSFGPESPSAGLHRLEPMLKNRPEIELWALNTRFTGPVKSSAIGIVTAWP
jgi:hypothetical protein